MRRNSAAAYRADDTTNHDHNTVVTDEADLEPIIERLLSETGVAGRALGHSHAGWSRTAQSTQICAPQRRARRVARLEAVP